MTPNLHDLLCQLHLQELDLGDTAALLELWVEGVIQVAKKKVKGRVTHHTEIVITNGILLANALAQHKYRNGAPIQTLDEMIAAAADAKSGENAGEESAFANDPAKGVPGMHAMWDKGKKATQSQMEELMPLIIDMFMKNPGTDEDLHEIDLAFLQRQDENPVVWLHKEASVGGVFRINSTGYNRQQSRQSYWILANWTQLMPGSVELYVRVELSPDENGSPRFLRVAICKFWKWLKPLVDRDLGDQPTYRFMLDNLVVDSITGQARLFALPMDSIEAPLIHTSQTVYTNKKPGVPQEQYLFVGYSHLSGLKH